MAECKFRQGNGNCAILEQASHLLTKPVEGPPTCKFPRKSEKSCKIAKDWKSLPDSAFAQPPTTSSDFFAPMGEID